MNEPSTSRDGVGVSRGGTVRLDDGTVVDVDDHDGAAARLRLVGTTPFETVRVDLDREAAVELASALLCATARGADRDGVGTADGSRLRATVDDAARLATDGGDGNGRQ
jgi:hypothetical protein